MAAGVAELRARRRERSGRLKRCDECGSRVREKRHAGPEPSRGWSPGLGRGWGRRRRGQVRGASRSAGPTEMQMVEDGGCGAAGWMGLPGSSAPQPLCAAEPGGAGEERSGSRAGGSGGPPGRGGGLVPSQRGGGGGACARKRLVV